MIKVTRRRRLVEVKRRVVFGTKAAVEQVLAACGWQINTSFVERVNLSIRQHVAAVGRRVMTLCKGEDGLRQQLALYHGYDNFCLPHASVRQPLPQPEPTNGNGSAKLWQPRTPAMAAGRADRVWTLREVLLFRVPPCVAAAADRVRSWRGGSSGDKASQVRPPTGEKGGIRLWNPDLRGQGRLIHDTRPAPDRSI